MSGIRACGSRNKWNVFAYALRSNANTTHPNRPTDRPDLRQCCVNARMCECANVRGCPNGFVERGAAAAAALLTLPTVCGMPSPQKQTLALLAITARLDIMCTCVCVCAPGKHSHTHARHAM